MVVFIMVLIGAAFFYCGNHLNTSPFSSSIDSKTDEQATQHSQSQEQLNTEYYYLMKDVSNMLFFSDFTKPEDISADELLLFAYSKAETGMLDQSGGLKANDFKIIIKKYFNLDITNQLNSSYFTYDANNDSYIPTGWSFDGTIPHYLISQTKNPDGSVTATFDVFEFSDSDQLFGEQFISDPTKIPTYIKRGRAKCTFYRKSDQGKTYLQIISYNRWFKNSDNPFM